MLRLVKVRNKTEALLTVNLVSNIFWDILDSSRTFHSIMDIIACIVEYINKVIVPIENIYERIVESVSLFTIFEVMCST